MEASAIQNAARRGTRVIPFSRWGLLAAVACAGLMPQAGCKRPADASARSGPPVSTPAQVVEALHAARKAGRLNELDRYMPAGEGRRHAETILAVDQVLAANRALQAAGTRVFGAATMSSFDVSTIGNSYGGFSIEMHVVREAIDGKTARVMVQEGDAIPLVPIQLELREGRWLVLIESPEPGLAARLDKLARTLDDTRRAATRADSSYKSLVDSFRYRVLPQIAAIEQAEETAGESKTTAGR